MGETLRDFAVAASGEPTTDAPALVFPILSKFYRLADPITFACLRVSFGLILATHGLPKLLGESHGSMANPLAVSVSHIHNQLHLPAPWLFGYFVTFLETGGALMLALGLLTRIVAPMIAVEMAAICFVLSPTWVWFKLGMEYPLLMGFVALYISIKGSGRYSFDRWIGREI